MEPQAAFHMWRLHLRQWPDSLAVANPAESAEVRNWCRKSDNQRNKSGCMDKQGAVLTGSAHTSAKRVFRPYEGTNEVWSSAYRHNHDDKHSLSSTCECKARPVNNRSIAALLFGWFRSKNASRPFCLWGPSCSLHAFCNGDMFVCSLGCASEQKVNAVCCLTAHLQPWRMDGVIYGIQSASLSDLVSFHQKSVAQICL